MFTGFVNTALLCVIIFTQLGLSHNDEMTILVVVALGVGMDIFKSFID